ncbi:hypothetical protein RHGRI_027350 [Rhododendron griersonianum]|uniref:Glycosyltransferase N-terminal domain-containing protein n=1 Tax=Rhododendron griersonianum TaxID=479676 RepID=A0AAV6J014_9ERIC|nr:hypothetical protein RHGRI_027350 [Rhododendron griersonianum]
MDSKQSSNTTKVLMLPWLAQGHITPFLELAKKLSTKNFHIYLCSTPIILTSIQNRITETQSLSIQLVPFHLPPTPELPPHRHTTNGLPPHLLRALIDAFEMESPSFTNTLQTLSPDLVIYDVFRPRPPSTDASEYKIPAVELMTSGAAVVSFGYHKFTKSDVEFPFPELQLNSNQRFPGSDRAETRRRLESPRISCKMTLINSFRELEGKYIDYLPILIEKKFIPTGPLVQGTTVVDGDKDSEILQWLGAKDEFSTVFVSFGSESFLSKEEREEIAHGLELSGVNFIWIVRITKTQSLSIELEPFHLPPTPELPPHRHTTNGLPPHLLRALIDAFEMESPSLTNILRTLSPDLVIYDGFRPRRSTIASSEYNIPAVELITSGAAVVSFVYHMFTKPDVEYPFPELHLNPNQRAPGNDRDRAETKRRMESTKISCKMMLFNSFRELEGKYIDYLPILVEKKIIQTGPLVQEIIDGDKDLEILQWLGTKDEQSTVFVSFGSESFLTMEEREEVAHGLELSGVSFIWIVRFPAGERTEVDQEALPVEFLKSAEVKRDENRRLDRENIAHVIRKVVVDEEGVDVRNKAREFSEIIRKKGDEEMDGVVKELAQLCTEGKLPEN